MENDMELEGDTGFAALGLESRIVEGLTRLGYEEPTPIQLQAIPPLLQGRDLVGQAATGTGKTAAFALPLIQRLAAEKRDKVEPRALILVPTRELAIQVAEAIHSYGRELRVSVVPIYGGQAYGQQIRALERGVDIVVATPGRALDHMRRQTMKLGSVKTVVLDEADEMLDMGFLDDIETILGSIPSQRQVMLFSATLPPRISSISRRYLKDPVEIKIVPDKLKTETMPQVRQTAYIVPRSQKPEALGRVLDMEDATSAIIFCRTRNEVDQLGEILKARSYEAETLHGGMAQAQRDRVIKRLRAGQIDLVLATDVASRGLDIEQLTHVINYDVPASPESYVHRIGRVGRAGREGIAITLAEPREHRMLRNIEQLTKQKMQIGKVPTVSDLKARRLELTLAAVREAVQEDDLEPFRVIVEELTGEFETTDITLAALKLAHQAMRGAEPDQEFEEMFRIAPIHSNQARSAPKNKSKKVSSASKKASERIGKSNR